MSLYLGENLVSGVVTSIEPTRNIGQIIQSTIPLTDAGLHLLDGSLIQGNGIYADFVNYIAELFRIDPYAAIFAQPAEGRTAEQNWQASVSYYGVCGKFVYDSVNNTVRLPKITGKLDGTTDTSVLGDLSPLFIKLPNITGDFVSWSTSGAFSQTDVGTTDGLGAGSYWAGTGKGTVNFSASRSSSVYSGNGSDTNIHEQAVKTLFYIVIATTTKTDIEVDIDEVSSDLNALTGQMSNLNTLVQQMSVMFNNLYPVGSVYLGIQNNGTCPIASLIPGSTWELVSQDRALWGGNGTNANTWIAAGLPNITGSFNRQCFVNYGGGTDWGALYTGSGNSPQTAGGTDGGCPYTVSIDASRSSSIYGNSSTVQPPAYRVNVWVRTA